MFANRKLFNMSDPSPPPSPSPASPTPGEDLAACKLVRDADGAEYWKLTCACGKRARSPLRPDHPYGNCPRCGRKMKLPGYVPAQDAVLVSANPGQAPLSAPSKTAEPAAERAAGGAAAATPPAAGIAAPIAPIMLAEDEAETVAVPPVITPPRAEHHAAGTAADRLRPHRLEQKLRGASDRISAWPLAGKAPRALAAFIDLTFCTLAAGIVIVLANRGILPDIFLRPPAVAALILAAGLFNDGLVHLIWGGSLGKKLVVVVTRTTDGREPGACRTLIRAFLKWALIPGWIVGAVDPSERTLHDLLCDTLVLKGRPRRHGH